MASDDQIGPDPSLVDGEEGPSPVEYGGTIDEGSSWRYRLDVGCGVATLGELNGIVWTQPVDEVPAEWQSLVESGAAELEIRLDAATKTISATAGGRTLTYEPAPIGTSPDPCAD